jgi:hypothetical protein
MLTGGENLFEDEFSHKGIDKAAQINKAMIDSNEYRRKFDNATDNPKANKTLYDCAKEILYDRSGTRFESMRWIDGDTGEIIAKFDQMGKSPELSGEKNELKVSYNDSVLHKLAGHNNVIVLHNHPNSTAPSAGDFNAAYLYGYRTGFVAAHNGRLFKYSSNEMINENIYLKYWEHYAGIYFDELKAQEKAIEKISRNSNITFKEVFK